ncbi:MAG: peptide deformylase [Firmicutes bacterium HGW-Firmicutes-16]|nr:MAG: peptide deformylase [Firmicutes bacterium HGW-Firmicutes-16]
MALRKIMRYDKDDILKKKSIKVDQIDKEILTLLKDMADTMYSANAFGLSAVQIGILKRVVVLKDETGLINLINPVIIRMSGEQQVMEGCLSIPGIYGKVKRPDSVLVKALNDRGKTIVMEGKGFLARVVCHEIDHLDGVLFIDKIIPGTFVNYNYF